MNSAKPLPLIVLNEKCERRLRCIKVCPVNAIRVKRDGPIINWSTCINCGECINACPSKAIRPFLDTFINIEQFEYKVILPSPAIYSHFGMNVTPSMILSAFKALGFDEVFDISPFCGAYAFTIKAILEKGKMRTPLISSICPVVVRLIQVKYPSLIPHLAPVVSPRHLASIMVEEKITKAKQIDRNKFGIIYLTPCASKLGEIKGSNPWSSLDGVMGIRNLYNNIAILLKDLKSEMEGDLDVCSCGIRWATIGGMAELLGNSEVVLTSGIQNVMRVLNDVENGALRGISFVECFACNEGCLGAPLVVEGAYSTRRKILTMFEWCKDKPCEKVKEYIDEYLKRVTDPFEMWGTVDVGKKEIEKKVKVLMTKEELMHNLPEVDCGLCGAPSCEVFAEDIALGEAELTDCIFYKLKEKIDEVSSMLTVGKLEKRKGGER